MLLPNITLVLLSILFSFIPQQEAISYFTTPLSPPLNTRSKASMIIDEQNYKIYSFFGASSPTGSTGTLIFFTRIYETELLGNSLIFSGVVMGNPLELTIPGLLPQAQGTAALSFYYQGANVIYIIGGSDGTNSPIILQWVGQAVSTAPMTSGGTAGMTFVRSTSSRDPEGGRGYYFGGYDKTGVYHNDAFMFNFTTFLSSMNWVAESVNLVDVVKPSPRAYHSAVITAKSEDMFVFGGENGAGGYFGDLWRLSPVGNSYQWTQLFPSGPAPCARSGHEAFWAKSSNVTNDERGFYIFGGTNGTHVFDDLWYFSIATSTWMQIDPYPAPSYKARAYYSVSVWYSEGNGSFAFIYGGIDSSFNVQDYNWFLISLSDIYIFCDGIMRRSETCYPIVQNHQCFMAYDKPFKCNTNCVAAPSGCRPYFPCNQTTCWDGTCRASFSDCNPIYRCDVFEKRCSDGSCKAESDPSCKTSPPCTPPLQLCADGTCASRCPRYRGCLPDSKPVLCADGTCAASVSDCNALCSPMPFSCYGGCSSSCLLPLPPPLFTLVEVPYHDSYLISDTLSCEDCNTSNQHYPTDHVDPDSNHIAGIGPGFPDGTASPISYSVRNVEHSILESAGPYPTWTAYFNYSFFYTIAVNLTVKGNKSPGNISLFLEYYGPKTENPQQNKCVGTLVPWYWSVSDLDPRSVLANDSMVLAVKDLIAISGWKKPEADHDFWSIPNITTIQTPKYRWNCIYSAGWYVPSAYWDYQTYGVYFQSEMLGGEVVTIISTPVWETPWPPVDKPAHYAVLGVAAGVLVTVLAVVIFKAAQKDP